MGLTSRISILRSWMLCALLLWGATSATAFSIGPNLQQRLPEALQSGGQAKSAIPTSRVLSAMSFSLVQQRQPPRPVPSLVVLYGKKAARSGGKNAPPAQRERIRKPKDDVIEVEAVVLESLPNAMFRCAIDGASETQEPVLATISGKIRKNFVKILVGDKVLIELSPYDLTRGRITFRYR